MLKVLDFYTSGKLSANRLKQSIMHDILFCVLVELNGKPKELAVTVTKRYHYTTYKSAADFIPKKAHEYNVLFDFLVHSKTRVKAKWDLSEGEFQELIAGLEMCLIEKYSDCNLIRRFALLGEGIIRKFVNVIKMNYIKLYTRNKDNRSL